MMLTRRGVREEGEICFKREGGSGMERTRRQDRVETSTHATRRYTLRGGEGLEVPPWVCGVYNWGPLSSLRGRGTIYPATTPPAPTPPLRTPLCFHHYNASCPHPTRPWLVIEEKRDLQRTQRYLVSRGSRSRSSITNLRTSAGGTREASMASRRAMAQSQAQARLSGGVWQRCWGSQGASGLWMGSAKKDG